MRKEIAATKERFTSATETRPGVRSSAEGPELLARYGMHLEESDATDEQKQELLLALFRIVQGFVDLGFSIRPGEKFCAASPLGMDDVLQYIIPIETAPETSASLTRDKNATEA